MNTGALRHTVTLELPNGETGTYTPLDPADWRCAIVNDAAGQTILIGRYHPGITTATRVHFGAQTFHVVHLNNRDARNAELVLTCEEVFD
jgi:hypothetical protein